MSAQACNSCAFYDDHKANTNRSLDGAGLCRFNPPISQPEADARGLWPVVNAEDWCGHFATEATAA